MDLLTEYKRQFAWRDWQSVFDALPSVVGQTVIDLGCGVGDLAAEFVARGACVVGLDANGALLEAAESRRLPNAEFRLCDLREIPDLGSRADGIWCSFAAAYFPALPETLAAWSKSLQPGGWLAVTEIDDLFGHAPLRDRTRSMLDAYAKEAFEAGHYDFHMGRKLSGHLEQSGFTDIDSFTVEDLEFSFTGAARPDVLEGWRARFERMKLLRAFCGPMFEQIRDDFLACLQHPDHDSRATVCVCVARTPK